ncbi:hypothetical protein BDR06DRAFT_1005615 [Suillus hirtellus]|nr:hypothetical protein BDR06DRAFT_1005615 [Suillus hirtellus]
MQKPNSQQGKYWQWAKTNAFIPKLPSNIKAEKEKTAQAQQTVNAAIEWLIATDQPIQALEHPKFKEMIDMASCATQGVKIPGCKITHAEIMQMFKNHLT